MKNEEGILKEGIELSETLLDATKECWGKIKCGMDKAF